MDPSLALGDRLDSDVTVCGTAGNFTGKLSKIFITCNETFLSPLILQAQAGWLQHDFGHLSVFKKSRWNHLVHKFVIGQLKVTFIFLFFFLFVFQSFLTSFFVGCLSQLVESSSFPTPFQTQCSG